MLHHPLPPVITDSWPILRTYYPPSTSDRELRSRTDITEHPQCLDNRIRTTEPMTRDLWHISSEGSWVDGWHNPGWVTDMFQEEESDKGSKDTRQEQVCSESEGLVQTRDVGMVNLIPGVQVDAPKALPPPPPSKGSGWEMLRLEEDLSLLDQMAEIPSIDDLICMIQNCRKKRDLTVAKLVHAHICNIGLESHSALGNYIVPMFVECGSVSDAQQVFNRLVHRNEHSWTSLILGYIECGQSHHALNLYQKMQEDNVHPSRYTLIVLLKGCARLKDVEKGREIHADITKKGLERNVFVGSTLVDMYTKCVLLADARKVFDNLPVRNVVSWNAIIAGYAEHGPGQEALRCFEHMQVGGVTPDAVTFICILKACGSIGAIDKGREIHAGITRNGFERNVFVGSTLVDMYTKCGSIADAREAFDDLPFRNVVSWTALIAGYVEHGHGLEALKCFEYMQVDGISPNAVTFVCILKSCGNMGAIEKGRHIHADITQKGLERDLSVGNALVDMYAKCGSLLEARNVFDKLQVRDVVSWSTMLQGYGMNHEGDMALECFKDMQEQGVIPNDVTFTCLLTACSRAGLVHKGQYFFNTMREQYGITPTTNHYTCMVDLLAQSGHVYEAEEFLETMPCTPFKEAWTALLSACKTCEEEELGLRCFQQLVQMDPECAVPYVFMANVYAGAGRWDDAYRMEELRKRAGAKKTPASALIEVDMKVHEFVVGQKQNKEISAMLQTLSSRMKDEGHIPDINLVLRPWLNEEKEASLSEHAEKLAIAFGLLNTSHGQTLHVTKNLRMCSDCHNTSKIISRIERREIIVRDIYHIHHFKDGLCSCSNMS